MLWSRLARDWSSIASAVSPAAAAATATGATFGRTRSRPVAVSTTAAAATTTAATTASVVTVGIVVVVVAAAAAHRGHETRRVLVAVAAVVVSGRIVAPLLRVLDRVELAPQRVRYGLEVHEVAEAAARTLAHLVLATARLVEVGDGRELGVYGLAVEPAVVQVDARLLRVLLVAELDVRVAGQMLAQVVAYVHLFDLAVLGLHLDEELLEYVVEVLLQLLFVHLVDEQALVGLMRRV